MPSSFPAPPSPRRAAPMNAPGSIASVPRCGTRAGSRRIDAPLLEDRAVYRRGGAPDRPAPLGSGSHSRREALPSSRGVRTITTAGDVNTQTGMSASIYFVTQSMVDEYFYNADGELLVVPQLGRLHFFTEFGRIDIAPGEICVIPRGVKFKVGTRWTAPRAAICARITARNSLCPIAARSAPIAWPIRAISKRRLPPSRTTRAPCR